MTMACATPRIEGVHDRATFDALSHPDGRARRGPVRVAYVRGHDEIRVAYSVSRHCGGAVVRNRIRRRLRSVMGSLCTELAEGSYLLSAQRGASEIEFAQLTEHVRQATTAAGGRTGA